MGWWGELDGKLAEPGAGRGSAAQAVRPEGCRRDAATQAVARLLVLSRYELRTDARWDGALTAVASCTDEPEWAQACMRLP